MAEQMQVIHVQKDDVIFRQGTKEKVLYKILSGKVGIYSDYQGEKEYLLSTLQKDQCFGEMAVLDDRPRSATAVALEDASLAAYPEDFMLRFIYQNPGFAWDIMRNLSALLRNSTRETEKIYRMLLEATSSKEPSQEILDYIKLHTFYTAEGTPCFRL